jgi:glycerol 3-phosphatase-2
MSRSQGGRLIDAFDGVLSDLDGVVYAGPHAIDGATEALARLAEEGKSLAYVTNNASRSSEQVAAHLRELGAPAQAEQVFGSAQAGAELLASEIAAGARVLVVGSETLAEAVRAQGLVVVTSADDRPDAVIQGFSPLLAWKDLAEAAYAVGAGAVWVATNTDLSIPQERGVAPGNGTLVGAVRSATGREPMVAGKPGPALFRTAARHSGVERALVVGDRLDTDILGGNRAGMATVLVLTGIDTVRTALAAVRDERPTYIISTLAGLYEEYPDVSSDAGVFTCGRASARVDGSVITVDGAEDDVDSWRAACAAWWAAEPEASSATTPEVRFGVGHTGDQTVSTGSEQVTDDDGRSPARSEDRG